MEDRGLVVLDLAVEEVAPGIGRGVMAEGGKVAEF